MQRTPKGRVAAARAYQYLGVKQSGVKGKEGDLFSGESG